MNSRHEVAAVVYHMLEKHGFGDAPYSIKRRQLVQMSGNQYNPTDLVVFKQDIMWAIIKIVINPKFLDLRKKTTSDMLLATKALYGIVVHDGKFYLKENSNDSCEGDLNFEQLNEDQLIEKISKKQELKGETNSRLDYVKKIVHGLLPDKKYADDIIIDDAGRMCFSANKEQSFFGDLLKFDSDEICRYMSFDSLFVMLKNKSYRMCGLAGMNDKTEVNYFDGLQGNSRPVENDIYISSCSLLKDDLTMWRLYGDDGKGVCLVFKIRKNGNSAYMDFFNLCKVDYAKENDSHERLRQIQDLCENDFTFKDLKKWKHFFKAYDFSSEAEVRLLFTDDFSNRSIKRDWVKTFDNSIINPVVDFDLTDYSFPLCLDKIILGPKFPERDLNEYQLKEMLLSLGLPDVDVENSEIECYR